MGVNLPSYSGTSFQCASFFINEVGLTKYYFYFNGMLLVDKFLECTVPEQCRIIYLEGEFVMAIRYYEYKVNMYVLGDQLIEVFYSHKLDRVHDIQLLDYSSSRMNFYADQVSLNDLYLAQEGR